MKIPFFLGLALLSVSCIKTAEQVKREKKYESMAEQVKDSQGLVSEVVTQLRDMQAQLDRMNGKIEEMEHRQKQLDPAKFRDLSQTVELINTHRQSDATQLQQIQAELKEQRGFIEKVTATLNALSTKSPPPAQKKNAKNQLSDALELVRENKFTQARKELEALIDHTDLTPGDHNKVFHGLGRVEFYTKNYDKALVYFSKIFTKFPKSSLAPSSLLFIGRSLNKLGKNEEAREAFAKVTDDYPGSKEADEAKKEK